MLALLLKKRSALLLVCLALTCATLAHPSALADSDQISTSTLKLAQFDVVFYKNPYRNDLLILWFHGGIMTNYDDPLNDQLICSDQYFQDGEARAFALAGIDVLEPLAFTMNWADRGHWVFDIMSEFNATRRGYHVIAIGGDSGGGAVVANVVSHYPAETAVTFGKAIVVSAPVNVQDDGVFDSARYAGQAVVSAILVIHGLADRTIPSAQSVAFFNNLPDSIAKHLILVDGATHITVMGYAIPLIISFVVPPLLETQIALFINTTSVNATIAEPINMTIMATLNDTRPLVGIDVQVQYYVPDNSTWITLQNLTTNETGEAAYSYQPTAVNLPYEIEFRAVYLGNSTLKSSISSVYSVNVASESTRLPLIATFVLLATTVLVRKRTRIR